jgi:putative salt-induced outer membrane protein YdiY
MRNNTHSNTSLRHAVVVLACTAGLPAANAQDPPPIDGRWHTLLGAGLTYASGNTNAATLTAKADAVRATEDDKWTLYGEALRARTDDVTTGNRIRLSGRYDWNLTQHVFTLASLDLERDTLAELSRRTTVNGGLGYKLIDRDELRTSVFGGLGYTEDRYLAPQEVDGETRMRFGRPTALLGEESAHKFSASTSASQRLVVNADLKETREYRAQWDASLGVAMTSTINLTVGLSVRYDSARGNGVKATDTLFTTGIAMKFE